MAINLFHDATGGQLQPTLNMPTSQNAQQIAGPRNASSDSMPESKVGQHPKTELPIDKAVDKIKETVSNLAQSLQFSIDEDTGKTVVKVMDSQTQEIIRQIPSKEAISIARTLDKVQGLLLNDKA